MRGVTVGLAVLVAAGLAGCRHKSRRAAADRDCCPPGVGLGEPLAPGGSRIVPQPEVPVGPPRTVVNPPADVPERRNYIPETLTPAPAAPSRELVLPAEGATPAPMAARPFPVVPTLPPETNRAETPTRQGLPGYAPVPGRTGVASGRKPNPDGFDTLKNLGYKTIVYVHAPGTDVTAARDLATARGLQFTPLTVAPDTLRANLAEFTKAVTDSRARPLYVADESGVRAGSLWYLLFRTTEYTGDDAARVRAISLGMPADTSTEEAKQFWLAVQQIVANP